MASTRVGQIVKRGKAPARIRKKHLREDTLESLLRDFDRRCAYCLQREAEDEGFKIDHYFPTAKGGSFTDYNNLYLSCDRCNHHKHDRWPTAQERNAGVRFLDCCKEIDYGEHLFEDENAAIVSRTSAGTYHRRILKLNRPDLVRLRSKRTMLLRELEDTLFQTDAELDELSQRLLLTKIDFLKALLDDLIPRLPHPPEDSVAVQQ